LLSPIGEQGVTEAVGEEDGANKREGETLAVGETVELWTMKGNSTKI